MAHFWRPLRSLLGAIQGVPAHQFERLHPSHVFQLRHLTMSRDLINSHLKTPEISQFLHEGNVDFRDCFERKELVDRLVERQASLPQSVREELHRLLTTRKHGSEGVSTDSGKAGSDSVGQAWDNIQSMTPLAAAEAARKGAAPELPDVGQTKDGLYMDELRSVLLYQRCRPSVVHIASSAPSRLQAGFGGVPMDQVPRNFGSGFVWDNQGHIITNYHVIHGAQSVQVTLSNNKKYIASLRGAEPDKDLAVLKIDALVDELVPVSVGVSSRLVVGQKVYAIGNPFGLDHTLTAGIVSGLGRQMQSITGHTIRDVVQTDASINPGNSGGPLLDSQGRLIGVNTAATAHPQTTAGFGFAIPSDTVRRIVNQIIRHGRVVRPGLGVLCLHDLHSRQLLNTADGVVVEAVVPGSGAAQAGLRGVMRDEYGNIALGDVIIAVGGQKVSGVEELVSYVEQFGLGDQVPITVRRYSDSPSRVMLKERPFTTLDLNVPLLHEAKAM